MRILLAFFLHIFQPTVKYDHHQTFLYTERSKRLLNIFISLPDTWLAFVLPKVEINLITLSVQFVVTSAKLRHLQSHTATLEGLIKREDGGYHITPRKKRTNGNLIFQFLHNNCNYTVTQLTKVGFNLFPNIRNLPSTPTCCRNLKELQHGEKLTIHYPTLPVIDYSNLFTPANKTINNLQWSIFQD